MAPGRGAYRINVTFRFKVRRSEIRRKPKACLQAERNQLILKIAPSVCLDSDSILNFS